jgi:hypothetical protein
MKSAADVVAWQAALGRRNPGPLGSGGWVHGHGQRVTLQTRLFSAGSSVDVCAQHEHLEPHMYMCMCTRAP